jgi:hypothetical protein
MLDAAETKVRLERNASKAHVRFPPEVGRLIRHQTAAILDFLSLGRCDGPEIQAVAHRTSGTIGAKVHSWMTPLQK